MSSASIFRASLHLAWATALWFVALTPGARAADCPRPLKLESSSGRYYVAVFGGTSAMRASFGLTLYTRTHAYSATLSSMSLERPLKRGPLDSGFRSYTALLRNPGDDPLLAAIVRPADLADGTFCPAEEWIIPSPEAVKAYVAPSEADRELQREIASEAGDGSSAFALTPIPLPNPFECPIPFAGAKIMSLVRPDIVPQAAPSPALGASPPETGARSAYVRVELSDTGGMRGVSLVRSSSDTAFDAAAMAAARKTTYSPRIFGCVREASAYLYVAAKP